MDSDMFYKLQALSQTQPIKTQSADPRKGVDRKHDEDARKKHKHGNGYDGEFGEDDMEVSIEAVRIYLMQMLAHDQKSDLKEGAPIEQKEMVSRLPVENQTANNAAAQAYQKTYDASHHDESGQGYKDSDFEVVPQQTALSPDDIDLLNTVLSDLRFLEKQGVQAIQIIRQDGFLKSLAYSVAAAKL